MTPPGNGLAGRRVAVTGARGRLGSALVSALGTTSAEVVPWSRREFDLDDPTATDRLFDRAAPHVVLHAAAWTDVDGCALDPDLALRRNGLATAELAAAAARAGTDLVVVSTNEVFDGTRTDGQGYAEADATGPRNPYGLSKLRGEVLARDAFDLAGRERGLWIVRAAWLFGPPGNDFPARIIGAQRRLPPGKPLPVVADEWGSPTSAADLAEAMLRLWRRSEGGLFHLVNSGVASRRDMAEAVLARCAPDRATSAIAQADFDRPSPAPRWSVLDGSKAAALGIHLRPWREAVDAYLELGCP